MAKRRKAPPAEREDGPPLLVPEAPPPGLPATALAAIEGLDPAQAEQILAALVRRVDPERVRALLGDGIPPPRTPPPAPPPVKVDHSGLTSFGHIDKVDVHVIAAPCEAKAD